MMSIEVTSCPYNEMVLPLVHRHRMSICTYFKSPIPCAETINYYEGDGTLRRFVQLLKLALSSENYDVIHIHAPHLATMFVFLSAIRLLPGGLGTGRLVLTVHSSFINYKLRNKLLFLLPFLTFKHIVFVSESSAASFPKYFRSLAGNRHRTVRNGVNFDRIDQASTIRGRDPGSDSAFVIASVGRLTPVKAPLTLVSVFRKMYRKDDQLMFIGGGPMEREVASMCRELGIEEHVMVSGLVPRDDVFDYLRGADVFVSTSTVEGLPVAVIEAMACARPVVLSDIPSHREVADGASFIPLVPPGDVDGFAREIQRIKNMTRSMRDEIGQKCRNLAQERFSLKSMHNGYEDVYEEALASRSTL
jgi:glycosyltransferase involved in cell wall biosynthesis